MYAVPLQSPMPFWAMRVHEKKKKVVPQAFAQIIQDIPEWLLPFCGARQNPAPLNQAHFFQLYNCAYSEPILCQEHRWWKFFDAI